MTAQAVGGEVARAASPRTVRVMSAVLERSWRRGVLPSPPPLDATALIDQAIAAEGVDDFGGDDWREPFERLLRALRTEADLNAVGHTLAVGQLGKALRDRLRAQALWQATPQILDQPILAPIVIVGSMRSGTTRVQRLLACDPRLASTRLYESMHPLPPAGRIDLRAAKTALGLQFIHRLNPMLARIHPTGARLPDEEFGLMSPSFAGAQFETQWRVPGFTRWWEGQDKTPVYAMFRRLLQTIAWQRANRSGGRSGGREARRWILKLPQFTEELDAVIAAFPDARLLFLHRDAVEVVASGASLVWNQMRVQSNGVDRAWVGAEWLRKTAHRAHRLETTRAAHPVQPALDIDFAAMRDWRGEMAHIYDFLGLELTPQVLRAMQRYVERAQGHHGHRYAPGDFGLTERQIRSVLPGGA